MRTGDRVVVKTPKKGHAWHTSDGVQYKAECRPGSTGRVTHAGETGVGGPIVSVVWDDGRTSRIDTSCLALENELEDEAELDKEALRLFGLTPTERHCKTCTCTD